MQLTPGFKLVILILIVSGALFAVYHFVGKDGINKEIVKTTNSDTTIVVATDSVQKIDTIVIPQVLEEVPVQVVEKQTVQKQTVKTSVPVKKTSKTVTKKTITGSSSSKTSDDNESSNNFVPNY